MIFPSMMNVLILSYLIYLLLFLSEMECIILRGQTNSRLNVFVTALNKNRLKLHLNGEYFKLSAG